MEATPEGDHLGYPGRETGHVVRVQVPFDENKKRALLKARPLHRSAHLPPRHTHPEHSRPGEAFPTIIPQRQASCRGWGENFNIKIFEKALLLPYWLRPESTKQPLGSRRPVVQQKRSMHGILYMHVQARLPRIRAHPDAASQSIRAAGHRRRSAGPVPSNNSPPYLRAGVKRPRPWYLTQ